MEQEKTLTEILFKASD